jgi:hypothetical protein
LSTTRLFIRYVGTADAYKRQGVATKLVHAAEDSGRERGAAVAATAEMQKTDDYAA